METPVGTIVGGAVGGLALIGTLLLAFLLLRRQRAKERLREGVLVFQDKNKPERDFGPTSLPWRMSGAAASAASFNPDQLPIPSSSTSDGVYDPKNIRHAGTESNSFAIGQLIEAAGLPLSSTPPQHPPNTLTPSTDEWQMYNNSAHAPCWTAPNLDTSR